MPLDTNGYDSAFKTFAKFARNRSNADLEGDAADATVDLRPGVPVVASVKLGQKRGV